MIRGAAICLGLAMATICDIRLAGDDIYFSKHGPVGENIPSYLYRICLLKRANWNTNTKNVLRRY